EGHRQGNGLTCRGHQGAGSARGRRDGPQHPAGARALPGGSRRGDPGAALRRGGRGAELRLRPQARNPEPGVTMTAGADDPDMAVALKYHREKVHAPRVVAKGFRFRAEQIKELAKQDGVAVLRNVPLAHALMRVEVGEEIPEQLYDAVA